LETAGVTGISVTSIRRQLRESLLSVIYPGFNIDCYSYDDIVAQFRYLGTAVTNPNLVQEEIKTILNLGNASYQSVRNLSSSSLLSKNIKIRIYKTIILPLLLYGCETWSLTLME
jgi:hypothetical protein